MKDIFEVNEMSSDRLFDIFKISFFSARQYCLDVNADLLSLSNLKTHFKIMSLNCRSLANKIDDIVTLQNTINLEFDVISLTETWLNTSNQDLINLNNYNFINNNRIDNIGGGTAIFIKKDHYFKKRDDIQFNSNIYESISIEFFLDKKNCILINIYRPPSSDTAEFLQQLETLLTNIINENKFIYLVGDLNIDIGIKSSFSLQLLNTMASFFLFPTINIPTRTTLSSSTIIDVIFTNNLDDFQSGTIMTDISDHFPLFISFPTFPNKTHCGYISYYNTSDKNLKKLYNALLNNDWSNVSNKLDCNEAFESFINTFHQLFTTFCPYNTKTRKNFKTSHPWFTDKIKKLINKKNSLFKKYKSTHSNINKTNFTTFRNYLNSLIKNEKKKYYINVFKLSEKNSKETWKNINKLINPKLSSFNLILESNTNVIKNKLDVANYFNNYFLNLFKNSSSIEPDFIKFLGKPNPFSFYLAPTSSDEIIKTVQSMSNSSSLDHHNMSNKILKFIIVSISNILSILFNLSFSTGIFPDCLKLARVVPVFKSGSTLDVANYRPISVLSCISKILESIINTRLDSFLNNNNIIVNEQFGFRKKRSTEQAIMRILNEVIYCLDKGHFVSTVFLDFSRAFDSVSHDILILKLQHHGIRGTQLNWFRSYLANRYQYVAIDNHNSSIGLVHSGVPQGSILGPKLFIIFINDLIKSSSVSRFSIFADDSTMCTSAHNIPELESNTNESLNNIYSWSTLNKINLNLKKTKHMIFNNGTRKLQPLDISLKINDTLIENVSIFKFLGVIIDNKLLFKNHVEYILLKINRNIGVINKIKHLLPDKTLLLLYYSLIYSHLYYGNLIWGNTYKTYLTKLYNSQKRVLKAISFRHIINTNDIFNKLGILPIFEINIFKSCCYIFKIMYNFDIVDDYLALSLKLATKSIATRISYNFIFKHKSFKNHIQHRNICFYGVKHWNNLPLYVRSCTIFLPFKYKLKTFLLCLA